MQNYRKMSSSSKPSSVKSLLGPIWLPGLMFDSSLEAAFAPELSLPACLAAETD